MSRSSPPESGTLDAVLTESARRFPQRIAVRGSTVGALPQGGALPRDRRREMTYAELESAAGELARLLTCHDASSGSRVGICLEKNGAAVAALFGVLKSGAAYVPLNVAAPPDRNTYVASDAGLRVVVCGEDTLSQVEQIARVHPLSLIVLARMTSVGGVCWSARLQAPQIYEAHHAERPGDEHDAGDPAVRPAYVLYTSGSTGRPKGVVLSHRNARCFVDWAVETVGLTEQDVVASHAAFDFDISIFDVFASIKAGATICLLPRGLSAFPSSLVDYIGEQGITAWYSVPSVLIDLSLCEELNAVHAAGCLQRVIYAGDAFPTRHLKRLAERLSRARLFNFYGPTETNVVTYYEITESPSELPAEIPIGRPCPYADVRVLNERGGTAEIGETGELAVRGDSLMQGYLNQPELTAQAVRELNLPGEATRQYYLTGDYVEILSDGRLLYLGRRDQMVKVNGFRVELGEVEAVLSDHQAIRECVVVPRWDDASRRCFLEARVTLATPGTKSSELLSYLKCRLPDYMLPRQISIVDALPKTTSGKIDRQRLASDSAAEIASADKIAGRAMAKLGGAP